MLFRSDPDNLAFIQGLKVEDEVSFDWDFEENKKNPNRPYRTIVGATPVSDVGKEKPAKPQEPKEPKSNRTDYAPDSMILSYAKDGAVALTVAGDSPETFLIKAQKIYYGLKSILAGE